MFFWYGEYTVNIGHLKPLNYLESKCQQMQLISDRIHISAQYQVVSLYDEISPQI
ncbi:hypothetical protein IQ274_11505 [Nostoc sp. LEGE 12447]|uniref:hypothetical protein n=1 Tax=Nostoc sp. LEGE 12447 TaxID=1828640 RepID=UPI0018846527|nr:hypothetical protein [Nostoc sp. LEGE 12447]MBE8998823.1 hypothetical protein [Nostoc sp. LEGE 12447]